VRYKCVKSCGYKFKGKSQLAPDVCPDCGSDLRKYILARAKGNNFEYKVRDILNLHFDLKGKARVERMPMSGAMKGLKGDLRNLPKPLDGCVIECKDQKTIKLNDWWEQVELEAIEMGKEPWLVLNLNGLILSVRALRSDLKLLGVKGRVSG